MINVSMHEIRSINDLQKLKSVWEELQTGDQMTIFQTFSWNVLLYEQWRSNAYNRMFQKVYVYSVEDGNVKILLPIIVQHKNRIVRGFGQKRGVWILGTKSWSDYMNAVYIHAENEHWKCLMDRLHTDFSDYLTRLEDIPETSSFCKYLLSTGLAPSYVETCVSVQNDFSSEAYMDRLSKNTRQNIRTARNRATKDDLSFECETMLGQQNFSFATTLEKLHDCRVETKFQNQVSQIQTDKRLLRYVKLSRFLSLQHTKKYNIILNSMMRMPESVFVVVKKGDAVVGYLYGLMEKDTIRIMENCFDEAYKFYSPMFVGTVDFICKVNDSMSIKEIDFTRGNESYKYKLGGVEHKNFHFYFRA